jgi:polyhydroxybutyrate depolymerase
MAFAGNPLRLRRASRFRPGADRQVDWSTAGPDRVLGPSRSGSRPAAARSVTAVLGLLLLLPACDGGARLSVISEDGVERQAAINRPARRTSPRPLLVLLHAGLLSGASMRDELEPLPAMARQAGVALAFPDADGWFWDDGSLSRALPRALSPAGDDLGFLDALIAALVADGTADPAAIHIGGVSNGGMMALRYACKRAERLASVAVFLATMPLDAERDCRPARPLPVLMVAGTADPVVRWTGEVALAGIATLQRRMSVPASFDFWRRVNRCAGVAPARPLPRRGRGSQPDVLVHAASGCADGVRTLLYEVRGGGHRLSAGDDWTLIRLLGRATPDIDPGALLLEFVLASSGVPGLGQTRSSPRPVGGESGSSVVRLAPAADGW